MEKTDLQKQLDNFAEQELFQYMLYKFVEIMIKTNSDNLKFSMWFSKIWKKWTLNIKIK